MASVENKAVANHVLHAFGGAPMVNQFVHDNLPLTVDILRCQDRPIEGVTSYSTLGLSDYPMIYEKGEYPARVEIAGACATANEAFSNLLSWVAFDIMRNQRFVYPGATMLNLVTKYFPDTANKHFYFTAPYLWEDSLKTLKLETKTVAWLLAFPISQSEYQYLLENGDDALENKCEQAQIDIFDLGRASCV